MAVRVYFLDNRFLALNVSSTELVGDLRVRVARQLGLKPRQASCFEVFGFRNGQLDDLARDVLVSSVERLVYAARCLGDALVGVRHRKQCLRLVFAQAAFCVNSGRYACSVTQAVTLAALQCRVLNMDSKLRVLELVPRPLLASRRVKDWERAILESLKGTSEKRRISADAWRGKYLDVVERWPSYGVSVFPCAEIAVLRGDRKMATYAGDAAVGVSRSAVGFYVASGGAFASRFFGSDAKSVRFDLADLLRWGHHADLQLYVELCADVAEAPLLDLLSTPRGRRPSTTSTTLRVSCATRDAARVARLLRDYALAKLEHEQRRADDDASTTDDDDGVGCRSYCLFVEDAAAQAASMRKNDAPAPARHDGRYASSLDATARAIQSMWRGAYCRLKVRVSPCLVLTLFASSSAKKPPCSCKLSCAVGWLAGLPDASASVRLASCASITPRLQRSISLPQARLHNASVEAWRRATTR